MNLQIFPILLICFLAVSCIDNETTETERMKPEPSGGSAVADGEYLNVVSYKAPCQGVAQQLCILTYDTDADVKGNFYNSIDGFDYVWGHAYQLTMTVTEISNPPADGSSLNYRLDEIVSDIEDSIGTRYSYERVELLNHTFTKAPDNYNFLGQPFMCKTGVDCDGLVNLNNSGGSVNVAFEYLGNGEIQLVQWN